MGKIENIKTYNGQVLDNIFFRPMLTGKSAEELGIKVMYNVPVPTTLHFWKRNGEILKPFSASGWSGGEPADKYQKTINLSKVKAEMAYSSEDYFSTVYELITGRADVNLDDLSGTELEDAETSLFRASIAEGIRATMWYGDTLRTTRLNTFDGFIKRLSIDTEEGEIKQLGYIPYKDSYEWAEELLKKMWDNSTEELHALRSEGNLVYFVSSDVYNAYEESLDDVAIESAYLAKQTGRDGLFYRGIPVVDVQMNGYRNAAFNLPQSFAILTDRRNLALAVNTNDFPGTEVRMWYNPDLMENRQRAIFMAGCDYLLPELVTFAVGMPFLECNMSINDNELTLSGRVDNAMSDWVDEFLFSTQNANGKIENDEMVLDIDKGVIDSTFDITSYSKCWLTLVSVDGIHFKYEL